MQTDRFVGTYGINKWFQCVGGMGVDLEYYFYHCLCNYIPG